MEKEIKTLITNVPEERFRESEQYRWMVITGVISPDVEIITAKTHAEVLKLIIGKSPECMWICDEAGVCKK